jgi:hypothetical protein
MSIECFWHLWIKLQEAVKESPEIKGFKVDEVQNVMDLEVLHDGNEEH